MEGTYANKQIGSCLLCAIGGQDACRGRLEIKNMRYVAVGDNSRMYRKGRATKSVKQILSLSTHFVDRLTIGP